jgi:SOUL heme-binding protein
MRGSMAVLATVFLSACTVFGVRSGTEEASYRVVATLGDAVQIREYGPRVAAEAVVEAPEEDAGRNTAFRVLFDYISGANRAQSKVAMTVPVEMEPGAPEIAMTMPVETSVADANRYTMRFYLPASFTLGTAPEPTDPRARIVAVPAETLAVLRFSGTTGMRAVDERKTELLAALDGSSWRATSTPTAWFYDPPWTLPFLRRNEVTVSVVPRQAAG